MPGLDLLGQSLRIGKTHVKILKQAENDFELQSLISQSSDLTTRLILDAFLSLSFVLTGLEK